MDTPRPYGDYVLLERLGVGGMSEVDLARKRAPAGGPSALVVIKRIKAGKTDDDSFVRMFKDEARITSELHHPNIARFVDFGRVDDEYYLALEYVPGVDLGQVLKRLREKGETIPLRLGLRVLCDVLAGLDHAHKAADRFGVPMAVVHRDVSPRNVMLSVTGQVKLIDFGVARATNRLEHTSANLVKGKFNYMAPEQIAGEKVDHRADVFAAGLLLHEMLAGQPPFHGLTRSAIAHQLLTGHAPPAPPHTAQVPGLLDVYGRALAADRDDRYASADAFRADLVRVAASLGGLPDDRALAAFLALAHPDAGKVALARTRREATRAPTPIGARQRTNPLLRPPRGRTLAWGFLAFSAATGAMLSTLAVLVLVWAIGPGRELRATPPPVDPEPVAEIAPEPELAPAPAPEPAPAAVAMVERPRPAVVAPAPVADPEPVAAPVPVVVRITAPAPAPEPVRVVGIVAPAPAPVAAPAVAPATVVAPEPVVEPAVAPVVLPVVEAVVKPTVAATGATGFLRVAASQVGAAIKVDGRDTGRTTPAEFAWPVGTVEVEVVGVGKRTATVVEDQLSTITLR